LIKRVSIGPSAVGAKHGLASIWSELHDAAIPDITEVNTAIGIDCRTFRKRDDRRRDKVGAFRQHLRRQGWGRE
jgi:hypothetical protein